MPSKAPKPKASPADVNEEFPNKTGDSIPASKLVQEPATNHKYLTNRGVPTLDSDTLKNILGVLGDIRKLLGPMRPDFKEEHWFKVKQPPEECRKKQTDADLQRLDKSIMEGISQ